MTDAVISALIDQLISFTSEHVKKAKLVLGVDDEVKSLQRNLVAIRRVLMDAEMRQLKEDDVKLWLDDLKDVSYDMDSVLDEWNTTILKSEFYQGENGAETSSTTTTNATHKTKTKVWPSFLFSCFHCSKLSPQVITHRLAIANEIQSLNAKLHEITLSKDRFDFRRTSGSTFELIKWPDYTTSFLDVPVVYGQDHYKEILIRRLKLMGSDQDSDQDDMKEPKFIPIVGMGGIGKTTLARNAYNDAKVKAIFKDYMIWVCVSNQFDIARIAKEIIEQLTCQTPTVIGLESLMKEFRESIKGKKFLLVLDDVWTTDYSKWLSLEQILKLSAVGSRVVVTTRNEQVAKMIGDTNKICLNKLTEEDCWLLLREIALSNRTEQAREDFDVIGQKIARKCNGLPLAVKTLGSLLRVKDIEEWHKMLTSEIWELSNVDVELFNPLLFSYYDLTSIERRCFLYCAIFPRDHKFDRDDLIQQWISQGFFKTRNNDQQELEQIGQACFQNLVMRSFFQDFQYDYDESVAECKMHDIVHGFAQYLTKNEYSIDLIFDHTKRIDLSVRHLHLINVSPVIPAFSNLKKKNLHTLIVKCDTKCMVLKKSSTFMFPHELLDLRCLRTLILRGESMELPSNIGDLTHLRYFSFYSDIIINVPPTIGNLFNLQTLKFFCLIVELPKEVGQLINLRHLHVSQGCILSWPKNISNLTRLQTLGNERSNLYSIQNMIEVRDIQNLNNLRKICLEGLGREKHREEAKEAQLQKKTTLEHLTMSFNGDDTKKETHEIVLETLEPHIDLKSLYIFCYSGQSISPSWMMSLINLRSLVLTQCHHYETLPPLGKLPCLKLLNISNSHGLKKMGPEFLGVKINNGGEESKSTDIESLFPKLKQLVIYDANSLKEWVGVSGWKMNGPLKIMPSLETLEVSSCTNLETLPDFLESTPLKKLIIYRCWILQNFCQRETGKYWPKIRHVPNIDVGRFHVNE
ncbi:putative disease resistance protein RGA1 [Humulus lupulus]|uniref:putative disease resistance protein RGA1 n=1 Tax=Humulus lupulus TaxID=3486 RepID=UPI002B41354D|nr:putative disease resistance protein RGA1 [Humulus lupulus]XP_062076925.1 putative disease resistance protein RGA1 [Humulus lupulus]